MPPPFFSFLHKKHWKKQISTSVWSVKHPNPGQNIKQSLVEWLNDPFLHWRVDSISESLPVIFFFLPSETTFIPLAAAHHHPPCVPGPPPPTLVHAQCNIYTIFYMEQHQRCVRCCVCCVSTAITAQPPPSVCASTAITDTNRKCVCTALG